jgi:hypothetical protein
MIEAVRDFEIKPTEYEPFRFRVDRPTTLNIQLIATAPVNLVLLDGDQKLDYEKGKNATHPYTAAWPRKSYLETPFKVDAGTWYLVVEGSTEPSRGKIVVFSS